MIECRRFDIQGERIMGKKLARNKGTEEKKFNKLIIPIMVIMAVLPMVVRYYEFDSYLNKMSWYVKSNAAEDFFNYYRGVLLVATVVSMIVITVLEVRKNKKLTWHKALTPLAVYAAMIILSTLLSQYIFYSLHGMENHFETVFVLLSYCAVVFFCYWFVSTEKDVKYIMYAWFVGIAFMGFFGIFQLVGYDLYSTDFGETLLLPRHIRETRDIILKFEEGRVYLTLYNPNYVGFVATLTVPILSTFCIFVKEKKIKIISFILNAVMVLCLMGSGARNGMIALAFAMVCMLVVFRKKLKEHWKMFLVTYGSIIAIFFLFNAFNGGMVTERLEQGLEVNKDISYSLENIETNEDNITIYYEGNKLIITAELLEDETLELHMVDQDGKIIELSEKDEDTSKYSILDERFPFFVSIGAVGGYKGFVVEIEDFQWPFTNLSEYAGYFYYTPFGRVAKIEKADTAVFTNYSTLASYRGYIWARTIPLLKDCLFVGYGPDTFTLVFPQKDYVEGARYVFSGHLTTKPHNMYLQIATQTGIVSLIGFLAFNVIYLLECLKIYWKKASNSFMEYMGIAIMISVIGYLVSGIINDSTVNVAPIYWCMMGIGLAINREVKKSREKN